LEAFVRALEIELIASNGVKDSGKGKDPFFRNKPSTASILVNALPKLHSLLAKQIASVLAASMAVDSAVLSLSDKPVFELN
jgi:hypothetical protein